MKKPKGKHIFGTVKVGEKGQIVIPKVARNIFNINTGDSLLVLGDEAKGLAIMKADVLNPLFKHLINFEDIKEVDEDESN